MSRATDHAYQHIRNLILAGELAPGEPLREERLAELCNVSRTPVRDALRRLETEAFVWRTESQRSFVADWSMDDIAEAFHLRGMLESHAAGRAAVRLKPEDMKQLKAHNQRIFSCINLKQPNIQTFLEHNRQFHAIILEAAQSEKLSAMLARLIEQPVLLRTASQYDHDNLERSYQEHEELLSAFAYQDSEWAESVMKSHIRRAFHAYADAHARTGGARREGLAA